MQANVPGATAQRDTSLALQNALKLGASLLVTWSVSLGLRFVLPRMLGPEQFGLYNFADAIAATFFVLATLGVDTYVQKEIPLRPGHASDFVAGITLGRLALGVVLTSSLVGFLTLTGQPSFVVWAGVFFALGQLCFVSNGTLSALLHARCTVDGLAGVNVASKALWGAGSLGALYLGFGIAGIGLAFLITEAARAAFLWALCRRHLGLRFLPKRAPTFNVLRASFPFFLTTLCAVLYSRLDITLVALLSGGAEAGWYGLANSVSQLGLLFTPLIASTLLPLFSKARARSEEELDACVRRSLEGVLLLTVPISLALALGADLWVSAVGGAAFAPAAAALRWMAPVFVLTYVATLTASFLNLCGRAWTVTVACLVGLVVNVGCNAVLIQTLGPLWGTGGAGAAAAIATFITELVVVGVMIRGVFRRLFDARLCDVLLRTAGVCAVVVALHLMLEPFGAWRLVVDALAWAGLSVLVRAVRPDEVIATARGLIAARKVPGSDR